jgi:hypothetical protein
VNRVHDPTTPLGRIVGILTLDTRAYDAVRFDPRATSEAMLIVFVTGLVASISHLDEPRFWQAAGPLVGPVLLPLEAWATAKIGTRLLGGSASDDTWVQFLRLGGFANITTLFVSLLRPIEVVDPLSGVLDWGSFAWNALIWIKAIKLVLAVSTGRAVATYLVTTLFAGMLIVLAFAVYFIAKP